MPVRSRRSGHDARTVIVALLAAAGAVMLATSARADHSCDALGEPGWSTMPSHEVVNTADGAPYRTGDDWFVDRTTTVLPLCNYINAAGNYSLRSYSLSPEDKTERVPICRGGAPVAPYAGSCPPK
jgi:hypothetical protein